MTGISDESDHTRSIFSSRDSVAFHDGSALTAGAVIWNRQPLDRDLHEVAVQLLPLHGPDHADGQPDAMGEGRAQLDGILQDAVGDRTVPHHQGCTIGRRGPARS
jgi:hypothetical protein